jgi:hypothetical protein
MFKQHGSCVEVPHRIPAKQIDRRVGEIPAVIFQTFKTRWVPQAMARASASWRTHNPEYEYRIYDDEECREFLAEHFGSEGLRAFDSIKQGAFKADFWRYCALFVHGGVYADIDTVCKRPLRHILAEDDEFVVARGLAHHALNNAFMAATPRHPFFESAINRAIAGLDGSTGCPVESLVSVAALGDAVNTSLGRTRGCSFKHGTLTGNGLKIRVLRQYASLLPGRGRVMDGRHTVLMNHYDGYSHDLCSTGVAHWKPMRKTGAGGLAFINSVLRRVQMWLRAFR